jgi:hypothetical protein
VKEYESSEKGEMVMKKLVSIFALLMAASMLFWLAGCGGDDDDDDCTDNVAPSVVSVTPNGGTIASNGTITVTLSKPVKTATITLGAASATSADNKVYTLTGLAEGAGQALSITAEDDCGDTLDPPFAGLTFDVIPEDNTPPELVGGDCEPEDGEDGVDPASVEEIVIVLSEDCKVAEVTSFEPEDAKIDTELDGDTLTISFLGGFSLGNEQEVNIEIAAEDIAGNTADLEYSFTTMAKE